MAENQTKQENTSRKSWLDFLAVVLAFLGTIVSFTGALLVFVDEAQITEVPLWPLPGVILIYWVLLGVLSFIAAYFCFRRGSERLLQAAWFMTGTFIPLIILGAFSIGALVMIAFLMFVTSTIILALRQKAKWLASFGFLMLGSICNLGILFLILTLGNISQ